MISARSSRAIIGSSRAIIAAAASDVGATDTESACRRGARVGGDKYARTVPTNGMASASAPNALMVLLRPPDEREPGDPAGGRAKSINPPLPSSGGQTKTQEHPDGVADMTPGWRSSCSGLRPRSHQSAPSQSALDMSRRHARAGVAGQHRCRLLPRRVRHQRWRPKTTDGLRNAKRAGRLHAHGGARTVRRAVQLRCRDLRAPSASVAARAAVAQP